MKKLNELQSYLTRLRGLMLTLIILCSIGVGNAWGQASSATATNGGTYVVCAYSGSKYYALPNNTTAGTWSGTEVTVNGSGQVTTEDAPTWTLVVNPSNNSQYYLTYKSGNSTYYLYKNGTNSSNRNIKGHTSDKNYWTFTAGTGSNVGKYSVHSERGSGYNTELKYASSAWKVDGTSASYTIILLPLAPAGPSITPSVTELDWGTVNKGASLTTKTFTITGTNLTSANLVYSASGGYSVSPSGKAGAAGTLASQTLTVTPPSTATPGTYNSTVTVSGGGLASAVTVTVKLTVQQTDEFIDELHSTSGYTSASPHIEGGTYSTPSIADKSVATSGTCEQLHYHFVGWITKTKYDAGTSIAVGDLQTPTTATGATYYAVWAKQGAGSGTATGGITQSEITTASDGKTAGSYGAQSASSASGNWTGNYAWNTQNSKKVMQINGTSGNSIISPTFSGAITNIAFVYTNAANSGRTFTLKDGDTSIGTISATASTTEGSGSASISGTHTSFYITANNALYIHSITVTYSSVSYTDYIARCAVTHTVSSAVDPTGKATVTLGATSVAEGATTTASCGSFTAGYELDNWSISGTGASLSSTTANPTTITMGTANVTVTANLRCITPTFSAHPSNVTCNQGASPSLSVTAAAGGASLSYQWMQCATVDGVYSNVASGGTSSSYSPSTASLGTMYYKCKVTNAATGCSANATSNAASVTVKGTVTYDPNGGTGTITDASSPYASGATVTVKNSTGFTAPAGKQFDHWDTNPGDDGTDYAPAATFTMSGNTTLYAQWICINPTISVQPTGATYTKDDTPTALSVTASGGTLSYQWKQCATEDGVYSNVASGGTSSTYTPSTGSVGTTYYKCVVTNTGSSCNTTVTSNAVAVTVNAPAYFTNGATVFIQADSKDYSAWKDDACVKAWFNASGAGGAAQTTYWLFDATDTDAGKKLFAAVVPASGSLNQVTVQRFAEGCGSFWNNNGTLTQASSGGVNTLRSYGSADNNIAWNGSSTTLSLYGSQNSWASSLATFADQGSGVWTASFSNYAPDATSKDYKIKTSYNNGWIGNTGSNNNATLSGMIVGSTYNITATLDVTDHSLTMSKTFVKGTVHFDLQGHGLAIADLENVTAGSKISAPSEPSATGYTFGGWFTDPECTDEWDFASDVVNETMTLYAKWTTNVYSITKTFSNVSNSGLPSDFTYTGSATTALNSTFTVNTTNFFLPSSITVTMGGTPLTKDTHYTYNNSTGAFTFTAVITGDIVITASATAKLKSIAITTQPTTRKYFAGESFSSTGAVVTATMGDGSTKAVTASTTWTPPATPLAAGTSLTVTASYTENAIEQTTTTTIDVYSVTVNKVNEDGDAVSADGVTATWTVGTKALAASASGASKYVFKEWEVTGASIGSTSSANTTLSSPTANVVVNAVFWKPRTVKWSVNGNDSYATGGPTTSVAYNGTISTIPTAPSGLVCASTFVAWTDEAHNNGTTAKASTSYYESKLFTAANQFPNITAETTTFYAVFAEGTGAAVNTVMWSEDWTGATYSDGSTGMDAAKPSAQGSHTGKTVYGSATVTYSETDAEVYARNDNTAKGKSAPELLIKANKAWTISGIPTSGAVTLTLSFTTNKSSLGTLTVATAEGGKTPTMTGSITGSSAPYYGSYTITTDGASTINITFGNTSNTRLDDIDVKVASVNLTNYVTECDGNIVSVTYNANGGSTSCTNTTTDKTEDFTVCSSAPTRDYYTFAGWLCSADDEVYQANATIDADAIDADFTLTAQWTPVTYNITYNLYGGTNSVSNPANYNVTTATITLQAPTRDYDRFDGWYDNGSFTGDAVTSIPVGSHGDITLYAKWAERREIVFDADGTTTTIYRADDENMEDAVAGMGSVPSDPDAPSACSSKVFVGWSESEIDDETDDEPADLMKPAAGTVDEDKHYYAVWATESSETGTVTVFEDALNISGTDAVTSRSGWSTISNVAANSGDGVKLSSKSNAAAMTVDLSSKSLESTLIITFQVKQYSDESGYIAFACLDDGTTASFSPSSVSSITDATWTNKTCTVSTVNAATQSITLSGQANARVYMRNFKITQTGTVYTYTAYSTSCCATKVTLSQNDPEHGTIAFEKTKVGTCGDKEVSLTITPAAGYQLHSYEVATGSGKVGTKSVSPAISLDNNSSAVQNITLTFADEANGAYDVTASFSEMTVTSWTWTNHDGGAAVTTDPFEIYIGQSAQVDVAYNPSTVLSTHKVYTRSKDDAYINWPAGAQPSGYCKFIGRASTGDNTTTITLTHSDASLTQLVYVKVLPLPLTHFEDLVHGKSFDDVVATIEDNALSATKTTPTSDDWTTPNANDCESGHLHLVGWIRSDWPALVAYLNGTGDAPTTTAIVGAGDDDSDKAYFFAPNASINVQTFDGVTFYAVWAEIK